MQFVVAHSHACLPGHFPGRPLVPGVVVLDHVLAAIEAGHGPLGPLRLPRIKFASPLFPGQAAHVRLEGGAPRWRFEVLRGATVIASGEVVLA